jgi:hypothetical protein
LFENSTVNEPWTKNPGLFISGSAMTESDIAKLNERIERQKFVLDKELYQQLIRAKLARLNSWFGVTKTATELLKSQD